MEMRREKERTVAATALFFFIRPPRADHLRAGVCYYCGRFEKVPDLMIIFEHMILLLLVIFCRSDLFVSTPWIAQ